MTQSSGGRLDGNRANSKPANSEASFLNNRPTRRELDTLQEPERVSL
jgi:hypothetical protein